MPMIQAAGNWRRVWALVIVSLFILAFSAENSPAQGIIVYPAKGQSQIQQQDDEGQCMQWAKQQSGFDPLQRPPTQAGGAPSMAGGVVKGGAAGAAVGAVGGAIGGSAGKGAAIGAASGALLGGLMRKREAKQQEEVAQEQSAQYANKRSVFDRAYSACLQGRGYTVK